MKILRRESLGSNFTGPYKKKECTVIFITIKVHEYFSVMVSGNDCKYYNLNES